MKQFPDLTLAEDIWILIIQNGETLFNSWDIHGESRGSWINSMAKLTLG